MALIKSLAAADAGLPANWTGTTRSTVAHVRDFEGLYHECLAKETRFKGARRVENLLLSLAGGNALNSSDDLTGASSIATISYADGESTLTATGSTDYCRWYKTVTNIPIFTGRDYVLSAEIKGSGASIGETAGIQANSGSGNEAATITLTANYQRVALTLSTSTSTNLFAYFLLGLDAGTLTSGEELIVKNLQIEDVTGQTNTNPGDYVSVGVYRENLLPYSDAFDNAGWAKTDITPTVSGSGDDNTPAYKLTMADATNILSETVTVTASTEYTVSFYAKRGTSTSCSYAIYDVSNTAYITTATSYYSSINSSTYTRVTATFTTPSGCTSVRIDPVVDAGAGDMYMHRAQLELGDTATAGIYTNGAAAKNYDNGQGINGADGVQYFNYQNGNTVTSNVVTEAQGTAITGISILLEPLKQNKLSHWDMTATLGWTQVGLTGIAAYTGDSPVKGQTAYTLTETSANESHYAQGRPNSTGFTSGVTYTASALVKAGTRDDVALYFNVDCFPSADRSAHFDLTAGTTSYSGTGTATIEATGFDGWYLITFTQTADATDTGYACVLAMSDGSSISYLGNGSTVHYCTPQVEEGEVATTPIEVTGTANQQRNADTAPYAPLTTPQSAGTVVIEFAKAYPQTSTGAQGIVTFDDVTNSGPLIRSASSDDIIADDDTTTATDTLTGDVTAFAARWDDATGGEMQVGFRTGASTWAWGTASATYDGGFASDNNVYLLQSLAEAANVSDFNAYDDVKTTSWIESNYPPSAGGITGSLSAQETGTDTAALTGEVLVSGTLTVQETGTDGAAIAGTVLVAGTLSVQEIGSDTATILGTAPATITGTLAAQETGSDTATISGFAPVEITGTLAVTEAGSDSAAIIGTVEISGALAVQEIGSDSVSISFAEAEVLMRARQNRGKQSYRSRPRQFH